MALGADATSIKFQLEQCKTAIDRTASGLGDICTLISSINRKQAKIRDKGDDLASAAVEYAQSDLPTIQKGLDSFGRTAANVQEYRDAYLHSVERNVINPISYYHKECKEARAELTKIEKETKKYEKTLKNPTSPDSAIVRNRVVSNTEKMKESILKFEEKRLQDVKKNLQEYCRLEMTFAAKCLEQWSKCYQDLQSVNPQEDLITFEKLVAPQRLMANLGYNSNRTEREQGLVSQLQNTSLTQPKSMQQQTSSFVSNFSAKSQNLSYGTPAQSARSQKTTSSSHSSGTNFTNHQVPSISATQPPPSNQTSVTQMQPISARSSNGNQESETETETETESETESEEEEIRPQAAARQSWAQ